MNYFYRNLFPTLFLLLILNTPVFNQQKLLDNFENHTGWQIYKSDGVNLVVSNDKGLSGNAIRFDYDFTKGTGYGGIQKIFPIDLPENFEFTFYIKAQSPSNNLEIKFLDSTGQNVWWVNNRNYDFPNDWKKIRIKKRHINFAWGPAEDQSLKKIDRIEFTIASFIGGKGTIWIDDLKFEPLPPETNVYPDPTAIASSSIGNNLPELMLDKSLQTYWESVDATEQNIVLDLKGRREFGGLKINWLKNYEAKVFDISLSEDGKSWDKVYSVPSNQSGVSFIKLKEAEANFIKLDLLKSNSSEAFGINEISFLDIKNSLTENDFLLYVSKNSSRGDYPRYFSEEASYWTIVGVNNDVKEALINEDGMVEVDKAAFSLEPMLKISDKLFNWSNIISNQSLEENYLPIPKVNWDCEDVGLETKIFADGEANKNSVLYLRYTISNNSQEQKDGKLFLLIRPFQVNPYYQFLNLTGGASKISMVEEKENKIYVNTDKVVLPLTNYDSFSASSFNYGNIVEQIKNNNISQSRDIKDETNLASGILEYKFSLSSNEKKTIYLAVPFYGEESLNDVINEKTFDEKLIETKSFWKLKVHRY